VRATIPRREINGTTNFNNLTSFSLDGPWMRGICSVFMYFFLYALCCTNPYLVFEVGSCLLLVFMIPAWCDAESFVDVLVVMICHVLFEIPLLYVDGILMCCHVWLHWNPFYAMLEGCSLSSCMSLCHTNRIPFWLRVPIAEHLLAPLLCEGIFLVW